MDIIVTVSQYVTRTFLSLYMKVHGVAFQKNVTFSYEQHFHVSM